MQTKTKSIPACANVWRTPRARVSHMMVPSAMPPALSVARSLFTRIALLPELRDQLGVQIGGALAHFAALEAHHPTIGLMVNRAVLASGASFPLQRDFVALRDDIADRRLDRAAQLFAERMDGALLESALARISSRDWRAANHRPVHIVGEQGEETAAITATPFRESVLNHSFVFDCAHNASPGFRDA